MRKSTLHTVNSIVFYFYPNTQQPRHGPDDVAVMLGHHIIGYIRPEWHLGKSTIAALDAAQPFQDEVVLNSASVEDTMLPEIFRGELKNLPLKRLYEMCEFAKSYGWQIKVDHVTHEVTVNNPTGTEFMVEGSDEVMRAKLTEALQLVRKYVGLDIEQRTRPGQK